jgi:hypothetical protein
MTIVTVIIKDNRNEAGEEIVEMEGHMDPPDAIDLPPTPSLIVGSYIAANSEAICKAAIAWFAGLQKAPDVEEPAIKAPKIILPDDGIHGVPV